MLWGGCSGLAWLVISGAVLVGLLVALLLLRTGWEQYRALMYDAVDVSDVDTAPMPIPPPSHRPDV